MNIAKKIEKALTKKAVRMLRRIGEIADELGCKAYLVGGPVRDILLGEKSPDIDITVKGDAIRIGSAAAKEFGGKLTAYRAFGTCTIAMKGGLKIDLATARKETYKKPGAFPKVEPSFLEDDLFRRDFTINAMAVSISPAGFGQLIDFFGGRQDLKSGIIRVMHGASFIDDPTRIFRAMRFASRFGFRIDAHTERLIRHAMEKNAFGTISPNRIRKELSKIKIAGH